MGRPNRNGIRREVWRPEEAEEANTLPGAHIAHTAGCPSGATSEAAVTAHVTGEEGPSGAAGAAGKATGLPVPSHLQRKKCFVIYVSFLWK
jgi:hypothetical protein